MDVQSEAGMRKQQPRLFRGLNDSSSSKSFTQSRSRSQTELSSVFLKVPYSCYLTTVFAASCCKSCFVDMKTGFWKEAITRWMQHCGDRGAPSDVIKHPSCRQKADRGLLFSVMVQFTHMYIYICVKRFLWFVSPGRWRFLSTESDSYARAWEASDLEPLRDDADPHGYLPPVAVGCQLHQSVSKRNGYKKVKETRKEPFDLSGAQKIK